ncbi:MAG: hypothetical protein LBC18_01555 [Opitutaceae bacterium]|jgi:hypothetical protein|nr:hypothetical protein [Opitutaceae bacterium]
MFNIYDQANKVTYPDYKSGYWQRPPAPADAPARDLYTRFTQEFGAALDSINNWSAADRMGGLLLDGRTLWLARVHNGGKDGSGRPHRWTLLLWREDDYDGAARGAVDIAAWLADPAWPAPGDNAPVPLPAPVPAAAYKIPLARPAGGAAGGFSDVLSPGEAELFPAQLEAGRVTETPAGLGAAQELWAAWSAANPPRHEPDGWLLFSQVGGRFQCAHDLKLLRSPVLFRREEKRRREEEEARLRKAREDAEAARARREREAARAAQRRERARRILRRVLQIALPLVIGFAAGAAAADWLTEGGVRKSARERWQKYIGGEKQVSENRDAGAGVKKETAPAPATRPVYKS